MSKSENPEENGSKITPTSASMKTKIWLYGKVALVSLFITGMWSLVFLPILLYNLPKTTSNTNGSINASEGNSVCSAPVQYTTTSGVCLTEFANILISSNCLPDPKGSVSVMRNDEATARQMINGFASLGASAECLSKAVPFFCLHVFGLCGGSGVSIRPTSSQCEEIRDTTCQQQWMFIERLDIDLPDCEMFPAESLSCPALNGSLSTNGTVTTNMLDLVEEHSNGTTAEVLECTGDFYQENGSSYCTRSCNTWVEFSSRKNLPRGMLGAITTSFSLLVVATLIIISCLSRKRMIAFPAIFVVYIAIDIMVLGLFVIVGLMDRDKLFCTSRSLTKSLREVTSFCVIFGIVFTYSTFQMSIWWIFHVTTLFWKVKFPLHALIFENSGKNKYIHITCIIVGILLPLVPVITVVTDTALDLQEQNKNTTIQLKKSLFTSEGLGFRAYGFPPFLCIARNADANMYTFVFMILILGCGCTMLIIILWSVHKLYIKRNRVQKAINFINKKIESQFTLGTAEKKLLIVLFYYLIVCVMSLSALSLDLRNVTLFNDTIQKFLICELRSNNSSNQCTFSHPNSLSFIVLQLFSTVCLQMWPVVNLLYVLNIEELKELWKKCVLNRNH